MKGRTMEEKKLSWRKKAGGRFLRGTGGKRIKTLPVAKGKPKPVWRHAELFK